MATPINELKHLTFHTDVTIPTGQLELGDIIDTRATIHNKVDKVTGESLLKNTERDRLARKQITV